MSSAKTQQPAIFALPEAAEHTVPGQGNFANSGRILWHSDDRNATPRGSKPVTRAFADNCPVTTSKKSWQKVFVVRESSGAKYNNITLPPKGGNVEPEAITAEQQHQVSVRQSAGTVTVGQQAKQSSPITVPTPKEPESTPPAPTPEEMFQKGIEQGRKDAETALAETIRQQAFEQGLNEGRAQAYQEGLDQGLSAAREEADLQFSTLKTAASALAQHRQLLNQQQIKEVALLLEHLVIEVVRVELSKNPEQICMLVEEAVKPLSRGKYEPLRLVINPDDIQWLQPFVDNWSSSGQSQLTLKPDATITRGGCKIEGYSGEVDATIEERLTDCIEQLRNSLLEDPSVMPKIDISPVRKTMGQSDLKHIRHERDKPLYTSSRQDISETRVSEPSAPAWSGSTPEVSLGAWGALGQ